MRIAKTALRQCVSYFPQSTNQSAAVGSNEMVCWPVVWVFDDVNITGIRPSIRFPSILEYTSILEYKLSNFLMYSAMHVSQWVTTCNLAHANLSDVSLWKFVNCLANVVPLLWVHVPLFLNELSVSYINSTCLSNDWSLSNRDNVLHFHVYIYIEFVLCFIWCFIFTSVRIINVTLAMKIQRHPEVVMLSYIVS